MAIFIQFNNFYMPHFPKPVMLPEFVFAAREERYHLLVSSVLQGIAIRSSIIIMEFAGVFFLGSSALFMDALSSLVDVSLSIFLIFFIRLARKPPDSNHPFGHGRFEPLIGLQLGLILAVFGFGMFFQQGTQLSHETGKEPLNPYTWIIPLFAFLSLEACYQMLMHTAKRQQSPAVAAEAVHYRVDSLTSLLAMISLICAALVPSWSLQIDHLGAIAIALFMIGVGIYSAKENFHQLMDRIPEPHFFDKVKNAAKTVAGVMGTEKIRIQISGPDAHVDIDVEVDPQMTVDAAHLISQKVRAEIQKEWPSVRDVSVHIEPYYPGDH